MVDINIHVFNKNVQRLAKSTQFEKYDWVKKVVVDSQANGEVDFDILYEMGGSLRIDKRFWGYDIV